jgi:hypothetical protein
MRLPTGERTVLLSIAFEKAPREKTQHVQRSDEASGRRNPPWTQTERPTVRFVPRSPLANNMKATHKDRRDGRFRREMMFTQFGGVKKTPGEKEYFRAPESAASTNQKNTDEWPSVNVVFAF